MKGTIKNVDVIGGFSDLVTNEVEFKHGEKLKFFTKKTSKNPDGNFAIALGITDEEVVGHTFEYEVSDKGNGKIYREPYNPVAKKPSYGGATANRGASTNDSILLQVCYKENMAAYAKENRDVVIENTMEDFQKLREYLKQL